jgi:hypothetical protein
VRAWSGPPSHRGFLLMGSHQPLDMTRVPEKIRKLYQNPAVVEDLREWGSELDQPKKVEGLYLADGKELLELLAGVPIITDDRPYTEFYLWRSLSRHGGYHEMTDAYEFLER